MSAALRCAVLRECLNRGGRNATGGCRYAMLGAIRRTGCSFVFRFVFKPPSPTPLLARARRSGLDKRLIQTIIVDSRWKSIQPTPAAFSVVCSRADDSISLFSPPSPPAAPTHSLALRSPRHSRRRPFLAPPIVVGPLVPPFLELESSIAIDSIVSLYRETERGRRYGRGFLPGV